MLDLAKLLPQVSAMADEQSRLYLEREPAEQAAYAVLGEAGPDWEAIAESVDKLRSSWLVAEPLEPLDQRHNLPPRPEPHVVVAVDGSQIKPDRHEIAHCFLLNIGIVRLPYGAGGQVLLRSEPTLYFLEDDLFPTSGEERLQITDRRLAIRRNADELRALAGLIQDCDKDTNAVALVDGTLILWTLEAEQESVRDAAIRDYEALLAVARDRGVPVAGYISHPGSSDVVNLLRAFRCGFNQADCGLRCHLRTELRKDAPCAPLDRLTDRQLFRKLLAPGQRSAVFGSRSNVLNQYRPENRTRFFYLNSGHEIARVEVPRWVAEDDALLSRVHAIAHDQAQKGGGYPRALAEAHEQAVVRSADRTALFRIVETALARRSIPVQVTRKALAKRARSV